MNLITTQFKTDLKPSQKLRVKTNIIENIGELR